MTINVFFKIIKNFNNYIFIKFINSNCNQIKNVFNTHV